MVYWGIFLSVIVAVECWTVTRLIKYVRQLYEWELERRQNAMAAKRKDN